MDKGVSLNSVQTITSGIMNRPRWWWYTMRDPNHYRKASSTMAETIMHPELVFAKSAQWINGSRGYLNAYRCRCGNSFIAQPRDVRIGKHLTCGCAKLSKITHGMSKHPLYSVHKSMLARCLNPNSNDYPMYGGRGISVCSEWIENRESFFSWAMSNGWAKGLLIDRIDVNGNYEPSNCRFVDTVVSARNKRPSSFFNKLTESDVESMRRLSDSGVSVRKIAKQFGVAYSAAWKTVKGINHPVGKVWSD
jgi:hypothetical protein